MNPYHNFVSTTARLRREAGGYPLGGFPPAARPVKAAAAPKALFFAPHPDDETISGALALRLMREAGFNVIAVAVTQGSKPARQAERLTELRNACEFLGFGVQPIGANGLERVTVATRQTEPQHWAGMVAAIADLLRHHQPRVVFFPHECDWNATHIGVHHLVVDALLTLPSEFECFVVETEFWGAMTDPNLMVEVSETDLADLVAATSFHVGEVRRNPYHLALPAWMQDNVRRGAELVGGPGAAAPGFEFAVLQRMRRWSQGRLLTMTSAHRFLSRAENPGKCFT